MTIRKASHAGSWYSSGEKQLAGELRGWITAAHSEANPTCRAIISPHAGYAYCGPTAAWAYKCIDVKKIKRVFILGPSHHYYLESCALSQCSRYATPLGDFDLDEKLIAELAKTGNFETMKVDQDEDEHSIEMQLPILYHMFTAAGSDIPTVVPILVGSISTTTETKFGEILAPYLADPSNLFIISSDFCHYGSRFAFTSLPSLEVDGGKEAPIHKRIEALDRQGMAEIESLDHKRFANYCKKTKNTICGRHPIGVLLAAVEKLKGTDAELKFVDYSQSGQAQSPRDSSVSYAAAYLSLKA
ncbi:hypothetical protein HDU87_004366 [Geranomyces variabilis]|uniref:Uncharacterized protein n=1 Tax=Geranomyces variabilis TaxID=109894 RepID=A0AAD5XMJ8_9FUNG|nr:hypothetical protein HDU87_004366 [Geranomyces variabilis]